MSSVVATECARLAVETWRACQRTDEAGAESFARRYAWFYERNPAGPTVVHFLYYSGSPQPVGMLSVAPREVEFGGVWHRAGLLFDFVVAQDHRTAFPALMLQRHAHAQALRDGPLYGLPGDKAVPIFKRLSASVSKPRSRFAAVVRSGPYLRRVAPGWVAEPAAWLLDSIGRLTIAARIWLDGTRMEWVDCADQRFEDLWQRARTRASVLGKRDRVFLQWRFFTHEAERFRGLLVSDRDACNPHTYFICELADAAMVVRDMLSCGTQAQISAALWALTGEARRIGASVVNVPLQGDTRYLAALWDTRFRSRERQACFVFLGDQDAKLAEADWHLTTADEDI